jgi:Mrp family chromosome partitioning ATPase
LGLADCLVLGRVVDSTLLVVRSGAHQLTTLYRAKGMLEQARVPIAGVVFNSLTEGLDSWSSYVTEQPAIASANGSASGRRGAAGLASPVEAEPSDEEESFEFAETGTGSRA